MNEKTKTYFDSNGYTREGLDKYGYKKGQRPKNFGAVPAVNKTRNSAAGTKKSGTKSSGGSGGYDKNGFDKKGIYRRGY